MLRCRFAPTLGAALLLAGCAASTETAATKEEPKGPPPRKMTALPVVEYAGDQADLLKSRDPKLAANKKLAYDFFRIVLRGQQLDQAEKFMAKDYMQHNPNADTGLDGFLAYFRANGGGPQPVPDRLPGLVAIQAEGDYVTLSFVRHYQDPAIPGETYYTTWFDMFRIVDGKIVEHWDSAHKPPNPTPVAAPAPKA
jgi:predicted SnoaL-like aldol condensation-catalyzing enzyme